jgi:hypothetical protein
MLSFADDGGVVGFPVVELAHRGSSSRLGMGVCIYLDLF